MKRKATRSEASSTDSAISVATQFSIPDHERGRVLGVYGIVWGMQPLPGTTAVIGVSGAVALVAAVAVPGLRTLRIQPRPEHPTR